MFNQTMTLRKNMTLCSTSRSLTLAYNCSLPSCACNALRIPNAAELQYKVSYASTDIAISSRIRDKINPRSAQFMVTCLIISSKNQFTILITSYHRLANERGTEVNIHKRRPNFLCPSLPCPRLSYSFLH